MKRLLLPMLLAACGAPANVQAPIVASTETRAPAPPTAIAFHVVAKHSRGMSLMATDGAIFVLAGNRLIRVGASDLAESSPPPQGRDAWVIRQMVGRWPDETRIAGYVSQGCRMSVIQLFKWDGRAWVDAGAGGVGYTAPALEWQLRRPSPKIPGCTGFAYSARATEESGFLLANAGCGAKNGWYFFTPGQVEGSPVEWLEVDRSDAVRLAGGSADDAYAVVDGRGDHGPKLMRFDGKSWSESPLPITGASVRVGATTVTPRGTLWLVARDEASSAGPTLFRRERDGEWRAVTLEGGLAPENVKARDEDVWVTAATRPTSADEPNDPHAPHPTTLLHSGAPPSHVVDLDGVTR